MPPVTSQDMQDLTTEIKALIARLSRVAKLFAVATVYASTLQAHALGTTVAGFAAVTSARKRYEDLLKED